MNHGRFVKGNLKVDLNPPVSKIIRDFIESKHTVSNKAAQKRGSS